MKNDFCHRLKEIFWFCLPLIAGQLGQMLFGIGDIVVAGRYSNEVVSALGIATGIFSPFFMMGLGITYAVGPIAARQRGEGKNTASLIPASLVAITIAGLILGLAMIALVLNIEVFSLSEEIASLVKSYLLLCAPSLIPLLIYQIFKEYLQAFGDIFMANAIILGFNVTNIILNIILIFGLGPFPELGIEGAAYATLINRTGMAVALGFYTFKKMEMTFQINWNDIKSVLDLGLPIGVGTLTEVLVFSTITILAGKMNVLASASHNIVLNLTALTFMVPLAISSASAVKVGEQYGLKNKKLIDQYAFASLLLTGGFMILTASIYFGIPKEIVRLATPDPEVIEYAAGLLFYVALFQLPDGIQVTFWGILRGLGVTRAPMLLSLLTNWCIGLPLGYYLAFSCQMEASGLWAGLAIGLFFMSFFMSFVFYSKRKNLLTKSL